MITAKDSAVGDLPLPAGIDDVLEYAAVESPESPDATAWGVLEAERIAAVARAALS